MANKLFADPPFGSKPPLPTRIRSLIYSACRSPPFPFPTGDCRKKTPQRSITIELRPLPGGSVAIGIITIRRPGVPALEGACVTVPSRYCAYVIPAATLVSGGEVVESTGP